MKAVFLLTVVITSFSSLIANGENFEATLNALKEESLVLKITEHGVVGDGETINTVGLQKAIDYCHEKGGGTLWFPAGKYVTGTIRLKSNITLSFDHEAYLLGSLKMEDYPTDKLRSAREGQAECLIYAEDAENIQFKGLGVIDGRGTPEFFPRNRKSRPGEEQKRRGDRRPRLICMENCKNLTFKGLTYKNPAFWGIHLVDCRDIHFSAVTIRFRDNNRNNDGIDLDGCENVLIEQCDIESGDDAICLKSSLNPCRNIVVRGCKVSSHTAALKFGTSSRGGFIDIDVSDCNFHDCPMGAIKLQSVDGGKLENIKITRITMDEVGCPIFLRLGNRGTDFANKRGQQGPIGTLRNVLISDIKANVILRADKSPERDPEDEVSDKDLAWAGPIMITGIPGHRIENVILKNIQISFPGHGTGEHTQREVPEDVAKYPEQFFFGVLPAWGAYIRHAENITFENVQLETRADDGRERIVVDDTTNFQELSE
ncbi:glycosyl hydrolase family 28 protein [bacterium]|nr:glycosyl hydrolase family 28 protein [bacterium]MDB4377942.1 glycosyl hydrolase family 28 protein [Akkermansiaceae bacterium]